MFNYSDDRMSVSYQGVTVKGRTINRLKTDEEYANSDEDDYSDYITVKLSPDILTVADQGSFFVTIKGSKQSGENGLNNFLDDTRCDVITKEHRVYIQSCLDEAETDVQTVGNKICEIYHGMII